MSLFRNITTFAAAALLAAPAFANPTLQLDIAGGVYDDTTETIVGPADDFSVFALSSPKGDETLDGLVGSGHPYTLSIAIIGENIPGPDDGGSYGSFDVNGQTIDVTADMVFGTPPIETLEIEMGGDLGSHGIFDTWFAEIDFEMDIANQTDPYNSEDTPGQDPSSDPGSGMLFEEFAIDNVDLPDGWHLHFDLYTKKIKNGKVVIDDFAPFSHDAESGGDTPPEPPEPGPGIPEPASVLLGLMGLGAVAMRRKRQS